MSHARIMTIRKQADHWLAGFSRGLLYALGIFVLGYCYREFRRAGLQFMEWDLMLISGVLAFIAALALAQAIPVRMGQALERLAKRGVFDTSEEGLTRLQEKMEERSRLFARIGALLVGLVMLSAFMWALGDGIRTRIPLTVLEVFLGGVAGFYIGKMVAYGTLGQLSLEEDIPIRPRPGHIDRAAGLKPIGDLYFFQAMVLAIPCLYLAVWWFLIPLFEGYQDWRGTYLGLLAAGLLFQILSFVLPMWVFHVLMGQQKRKSLADADALSKRIAELENRILHAEDAGEISDLQRHLDFQRAQYWEIEQMPTWPIDAPTRRRFTVNNLLLFLPFVYDAVRLTDPWRSFFSTMAKFLGGE